jgi:hypothetical protein
MGDHCTGTTCVPTYTDCDDGIGCTLDSCKQGVGCQNVYISNCAQDWTFWVPSLDFSAARYVVDDVAGTVLDKTTSLTWQRGSTVAPLTAFEAGKLCAALVLGGQSDWRLPSAMELYSLVAPPSSAGAAAINTQVFPQTAAAWFWSASFYGGNPSGSRFVVDFAAQHLTQWSSSAQELFHARCVRGGVSPTATVAAYIPGPSSSLKDPRTGLAWSTWAPSVGGSGTPAAACATLNGGGTTWRAPALTELVTLLDFSRKSPMMDTSIWQSPGTHMVYSPAGYSLDFSVGSTTTWKGYSVRCVQ